MKANDKTHRMACMSLERTLLVDGATVSPSMPNRWRLPREGWLESAPMDGKQRQLLTLLLTPSSCGCCWIPTTLSACRYTPPTETARSRGRDSGTQSWRPPPLFTLCLSLRRKWAAGGEKWNLLTSSLQNHTVYFPNVKYEQKKAVVIHLCLSRLVRRRKCLLPY